MKDQRITLNSAATVAELIRVVDAIDRAVDERRWEDAVAYFAATIHADFASLTGVAAADISSHSLVDTWAANLKGDKTSFHMATNHRVNLDADLGYVSCAGYAWNRKEGNGDPLWEVWGDYEYGLAFTAAGWRVTAMKLTVRHQRGNDWVRDTPGA